MTFPPNSLHLTQRVAVTKFYNSDQVEKILVNKPDNLSLEPLLVELGILFKGVFYRRELLLTQIKNPL
jgi:hypothetical protein